MRRKERVAHVARTRRPSSGPTRPEEHRIPSKLMQNTEEKAWKSREAPPAKQHPPTVRFGSPSLSRQLVPAFETGTNIPTYPPPEKSSEASPALPRRPTAAGFPSTRWPPRRRRSASTCSPPPATRRASPSPGTRRSQPPSPPPDRRSREPNAGRLPRRSEVHRDGDYHRAVHVCIYCESTGELLLQRRADCKDSWPGQWDISSAGHISAGDSSLSSAR